MNRHEQIAWPYDNFFTFRANQIDTLLRADPDSIDAIALTTTALTALASYAFPAISQQRGGSQKAFREILRTHAPTFTDRVSIPTLLVDLTKDAEGALLSGHLRNQYPLEGMCAVRRGTDDPPKDLFDRWLAGLTTSGIAISASVRERCEGAAHSSVIYKHYRNSVMHQLQVADGKEARRPLFDDEPDPYYANYGAGMGLPPEEYHRFGVRPAFLLTLLREVIANMKAWALANDQNLFA